MNAVGAGPSQRQRSLLATFGRAVAAVAILAATSFMLPGTAGAQGGPTVSGGGASFPGLELQQWRADVAGPPYNLNINYTSAGSTFGREQYIAGTLDYGVSDIRFQPDELPRVQNSPRRNFVYVPISAGALAFMYNVVGTNGQRITNLRLTQTDVCRLFTEPDITWNDPSIVATNPGVPLPASKVRPVLRSDGSGTSYVFSEFCLSTARTTWLKFVGYIQQNFNNSGNIDLYGLRPTSNWPQGWGASATAFASDGVARTVANDGTGRDSITYVETGFAQKLGRPTASIRNAAGQFTPPLPPNATVALGYASGQADGTFRLNYTGPDPRAYFPSTYSYVIAQTNGFDPAKGRVLSTFLNYAVTAGQRRAEPLAYARLSTVLVNLALDSITRIPGAPPRPTDLFGAPPPPDVAGGGGGAGAAGGGPAGGGGGVAGANGPGAGGSGPTGDGPGGTTATDAEVAAAEEAAAAEAAQADAAGAGNEEALSDEEALAQGAARVTSDKVATGPGNREVLFTLLQGAALVAIGTFLARGAKSTWQR